GSCRVVGRVAGRAGRVASGEGQLRTALRRRSDARRACGKARGFDADDPRRSFRGGVQREARLSVRPASGSHSGRAPPAGGGALRRSRPAACSGSDQSSTRRSGRNRCELPFRLAVGACDARVAPCGVPRAQLRRLVARMVAPRRPAVRERLTPTRLVAPTAWCQTPCRKCDAPRTRTSRGTELRARAVTPSATAWCQTLGRAREERV